MPLCYSPKGWNLVRDYFSYYFKLGCVFNLMLSEVHTTRVFVSTVPGFEASEMKKLCRSKTVLAHVV